MCLTVSMATTLRVSFARLCRDTRPMLDLSQRELAAAVGVSHAHIAAIEAGRVNPSLDLVDRIGIALGLDIELVARPVLALDPPRQRDLVHARCSGYVDRRLRASGWDVRREVEVVQGRSHGWIDLLAFDPRSRTLVIVEVKTRIDDLGAIERQLSWYERSAERAAIHIGWRPRWVMSWLLLLASDEVERVVLGNREALASAFPMRAVAMRPVVQGESEHDPGRGLALIDPVSRRRDWLLATRSEGRRTAAPYRDYADAAHRLLAGVRPGGR